MGKIISNYLTILVISTLTIIIYFSNSAYCFDDKRTHPMLTEKAADQAVFIDYLKNRLGFPEGLNKIYKVRYLSDWLTGFSRRYKQRNK